MFVTDKVLSCASAGDIIGVYCDMGKKNGDCQVPPALSLPSVRFLSLSLWLRQSLGAGPRLEHGRRSSSAQEWCTSRRSNVTQRGSQGKARITRATPGSRVCCAVSGALA